MTIGAEGLELDVLLSESIGAVRAREASEFDELRSNRPVVLSGAGGLGKKVLEGLRQTGVEPIAFCDRNPALWGSSINGIHVYSPTDAAARFGKTAAFVVTVWAAWANPMVQQLQLLRDMGCECVLSCVPLLWSRPDLFLPHIQIDLPSKVIEQADGVAAALELFCDAPSRQEYVNQVRWRLSGDFGALSLPTPDQYFVTDVISLPEGSTFIDVGAFDGDTVKNFLERQPSFGKVVAFEPDPANFARLAGFTAQFPEHFRERIELRHVAVAESDGTVPFLEGAGNGSAVGDCGKLLPCVALDSVLEPFNGLLKMDVEGFEPQVIRGARRTFAEVGPQLAVCVYHRQDHLWTLPSMISELNPEYRFYLRAHGEVWETVAYAAV